MYNIVSIVFRTAVINRKKIFYNDRILIKILTSFICKHIRPHTGRFFKIGISYINQHDVYSPIHPLTPFRVGTMGRRRRHLLRVTLTRGWDYNYEICDKVLSFVYLKYKFVLFVNKQLIY